MSFLLGFKIESDPDIVNLREDPASKGYAPQDEEMLKSLGLLGKHSRNVKTSPEVFRQFFRWALGGQKYPLPPLVRKILCMKRASLTEGADSIKTTGPLRGFEKRLLVEIDRFLKADGVENPADAVQCELVTVKGAGWESPRGTGIPMAPDISGCDGDAILAAIAKVQTVVGTEPLSEKLDAILNKVSECCEKTPASPFVNTNTDKYLQIIDDLQTQLETLKNKLEVINTEPSVKTEYEDLMKTILALTEELEKERKAKANLLRSSEQWNTEFTQNQTLEEEIASLKDALRTKEILASLNAEESQEVAQESQETAQKTSQESQETPQESQETPQETPQESQETPQEMPQRKPLRLKNNIETRRIPSQIKKEFPQMLTRNGGRQTYKNRKSVPVNRRTTRRR